MIKSFAQPCYDILFKEKLIKKPKENGYTNILHAKGQLVTVDGIQFKNRFILDTSNNKLYNKNWCEVKIRTIQGIEYVKVKEYKTKVYTLVSLNDLIATLKSLHEENRKNCRRNWRKGQRNGIL